MQPKLIKALKKVIATDSDMKWQPIDTYEKPTKEWDYDHPQALFYSKKQEIVIGRCVLMDSDENEYSFTFDRDGLSIEPTHWMPLPNPPM